MTRRSRVYSVAELGTVEGKRAMMRELFPEVPFLHNATAAQFAALTKFTTEDEWFNSLPQTDDMLS